MLVFLWNMFSTQLGENQYQVNSLQNVVEGDNTHPWQASPHCPFDNSHPGNFIWRRVYNLIIMHKSTFIEGLVVFKGEEELYSSDRK